jgi:lanosterol synthase
VTDALDRGVKHLISRQRENGCWEGEMVWCTMILSQYIIVQHAAGRSIDEHTRAQMIRYFRASRTPEGVWGMHPESAGYVFFTTLAYIGLRLLGVSAEDPLAATARQWLHGQKGGVLAIPSWGKFWLAAIGLYGYEGVNPVPPEMFLLPTSLPFHPHRYYCHTRLIYMGMAYIYGSRCRADLGPIVAYLRRELYETSYDAIDFSAWRHTISASDLHVPPTRWLQLAYDILRIYERIYSKAIRKRALDFCFGRILAEQRATRYQALSPVNGLLNCLAIWSRDSNHPDLAPSLAGMDKWKWEDELEGIRYVGARSNAWDTAFSMLALLESPEIAGCSADALRRAYAFLRDTQVTAEIEGYREQGRDPAIGGWCFSDGAHRWPVSDCTAEALCAVLAMQRVAGDAIPASERISDDRIAQAAEFILYRQNADGGFGTYERRRASSWLENVNPSEMYGQCMTERSYIECTASSISALAELRASQPEMLRLRVDNAIERGIRFLRLSQRPDGSYAGFWGVNFTYAIFHVTKGLRAAGISPNDPTLVRAAEWLAGKQKSDGGWGEHYSGCLTDRYVEHPVSQAVMTSWALLALMQTMPRDSVPVTRGIAWLAAQQKTDGCWASQAVNGVFFGSAMLDYRLYKVYFPVWALARYSVG